MSAAHPERQARVSRAARAAAALVRTTPYLVAGLTATVVAIRELGLQRGSLSLPLWYGGEFSLIEALGRAVIEHGWYLTNPRLGAPGVSRLHDFPMGTEILMFGLFKVLGPFAGGDWATAINLHLLVGFPLAAITAAWALRRMSIGAELAAALGVLFACAPYHFHRGIGHLGLSTYFHVPLLCLLAFWLVEGEPVIASRAGSPTSSPRPALRRFGAIAICLVAGWGGVYYAFFACFFVAVAGAVAAARARSLRPLIDASICAAVIILAAWIALLPSFLHWAEHGPNPAAAMRGRFEGEAGGFKLGQLLLPVTGHRIGPLRALRALYDSGPNTLENSWSTLGFVASIGLLLSVAAFAARRDARSAVASLGLLNLSGFLLGVTGGVGALLAFLAVPAIRSSNRVSIFLSFFSLAAVGVALQPLAARVASRFGRGPVLWTIAALVAALGLYDQTSPALRPNRPRVAQEFESDRAFVADLERRHSPGAMIFQLPYLKFPEAGLHYHRMLDYDHVRGYLHSRALRWSYGAMRGRPGDHWTSSVAVQPVEAMLRTLAAADFEGVYLDRFGYAAGDVAVQRTLTAILGPPATSQDGRLAAWDLRSFAREQRPGQSDAELAALRARVLADPNALVAAEADQLFAQARVLAENGGHVDLLSPGKLRGQALLVAEGWARDPERGLAARGILVAEGKRALALWPRADGLRQDVAVALGNPGLARSGWSVSVPARALGTGVHRLQFFAVLEENRLAPIACGTKCEGIVVEP